MNVFGLNDDMAMNLGTAGDEDELLRRRMATVPRPPMMPMQPTPPPSGVSMLGRLDQQPTADAGSLLGARPPQAISAQSPSPASASATPSATPPVAPAERLGGLGRLGLVPRIPESEIEPGPQQRRLGEMMKQPEPQLHGWRRGLDIAGQIAAPGIESRIPGTPGAYRAGLERQQGLADVENKQQTAVLNRRGTAAEAVQRGALAEKALKPDESQETMEMRRAQVKQLGMDEADSTTRQYILTGNYTPRTAAEQNEFDLWKQQNPNHPVSEWIQLKGSGKAETGAEADLHYQNILQKKNMGQPLSPQEQAEVKAYEHRKSFAGTQTAIIRNEGMQQAREYPVINTQTGALEMVNAQVMNAANRARPGTYVPAAQGAQSTQREALINDIRQSAQTVGKNIDIFDRGTLDQAKLAAALASPDMTAGQFLQTIPRGKLDQRTQDLVNDIFNLREQAMSLRTVLGAGQGSEDLRHAILSTLPGAATPNARFGKHQLDNLMKVLDRVERGVPVVPMAPGGAARGQNAAGTGAAGGAAGGAGSIKITRDANGRIIGVD